METKHNNDSHSEEHLLAKDFHSVPSSLWHRGRRFRITDFKAPLSYRTLNPSFPGVGEGDTLEYLGCRPVSSVIGTDVSEWMFLRNGNEADTIVYRQGLSQAGSEVELRKLPFAVDLELVRTVSQTLKGRTLYTVNGRWIDRDGKMRKGIRFLKVEVTDVEPGTEDYPFRIVFKSVESEPYDQFSGAVIMSVEETDGSAGLRSFENLFSVEDPRKRYLQITEPHWQLIRQGKVESGMTTHEATLSWGQPIDIDRRHNQSIQYERWSYADGRYLVFEDGILIRFL